jgi:hypothetical protein
LSKNKNSPEIVKGLGEKIQKKKKKLETLKNKIDKIKDALEEDGMADKNPEHGKKKIGFFSRLFAQRKEPETCIEKFYRLLQKSKDLISNKDIKNAKKAYAEAREAYIKLDAAQKKSVYNDLMEVYKNLKELS